jgi:23S rRNA (pseudouridine1915-N3)-methyltransferase
MKIRFLFVGKSDEAEYARGIARYLERISRFVPAETVIVKEERPGEKPDAVRIRKAEGERLLSSLRPRDLFVLCDESGPERTSGEFAADLRRWLDSSPSAVVFGVGGAFGLDPALRRRARAILPLSRMTLPHQLARLVLAEQVYRAVATLRGVAYSK